MSSKGQRAGPGGEVGVCRNFRHGHCHLGDACKYSHGGEGPVEGATAPPGSAPRRPFAQIVVLFASDARVAAFAKHVAHRFTDAGIDVFVNNDLQELGLGDSSVGAPQQIKPEHLSTVISCSFADFLVVLGDRNMRNDTVQARRAGKLVEMSIDERIRSVLDSWAGQTGLKPTLGNADSERAVAALSQEALLDRLQRLCGLSHLGDRLQRLTVTANEVFESRSKATGGRRVGPGSSPPPVLLPADSATLTSADTALVEKLTRLQTGLCKLHRELAEASFVLKRTPTIKAAKDREGSALSFPDLGLGHGLSVQASFRPGVGDKDGAAASGISLSQPLSDRLQSLVKSHLSSLELIGTQMGEIAGAASVALWRAYSAEYAKAAKDGKLEAFFGTGVAGSGVVGGTSEGAGAAFKEASSSRRRGTRERRGSSVSDAGLGVVGAEAGVGKAALATAGKGGASKTGPVTVDSWACATCTLVNSRAATVCEACGTRCTQRADTSIDESEWLPASSSARKGLAEDKAAAASSRRAVSTHGAATVSGGVTTALGEGPTASAVTTKGQTFSPGPLASVVTGTIKSAAAVAPAPGPTAPAPASHAPAAKLDAQAVAMGKGGQVAAKAGSASIAPVPATPRAHGANPPLVSSVDAAHAQAQAAQVAQLARALGIGESALSSPDLAAQLSKLISLASAHGMSASVAPGSPLGGQGSYATRAGGGGVAPSRPSGAVGAGDGTRTHLSPDFLGHVGQGAGLGLGMGIGTAVQSGLQGGLASFAGLAGLNLNLGSSANLSLNLPVDLDGSGMGGTDLSGTQQGQISGQGEGGGSAPLRNPLQSLPGVGGSTLSLPQAQMNMFLSQPKHKSTPAPPVHLATQSQGGHGLGSGVGGNGNLGRPGLGPGPGSASLPSSNSSAGLEALLAGFLGGGSGGGTSASHPFQGTGLVAPGPSPLPYTLFGSGIGSGSDLDGHGGQGQDMRAMGMGMTHAGQQGLMGPSFVGMGGAPSNLSLGSTVFTPTGQGQGGAPGSHFAYPGMHHLVGPPGFLGGGIGQQGSRNGGGVGSSFDPQLHQQQQQQGGAGGGVYQGMGPLGGMGMGGLGLDMATLQALGLVPGAPLGQGQRQVYGRPCSVCGGEGVLSCDRCEQEAPYAPTYYCGVHHQQVDFAQHRKMHDARRATQGGTRGGSNGPGVGGGNQ